MVFGGEPTKYVRTRTKVRAALMMAKVRLPARRMLSEFRKFCLRIEKMYRKKIRLLRSLSDQGALTRTKAKTIGLGSTCHVESASGFKLQDSCLLKECRLFLAQQFAVFVEIQSLNCNFFKTTV